jgi:hypothetical protein
MHTALELLRGACDRLEHEFDDGMTEEQYDDLIRCFHVPNRKVAEILLRARAGNSRGPSPKELQEQELRELLDKARS